MKMEEGNKVLFDGNTNHIAISSVKFNTEILDKHKSVARFFMELNTIDYRKYY